MKTPTPEQIERLPKWAQTYIESLNRALNNIDERVRELEGEQRVTPFYTDDFIDDPKAEKGWGRSTRKYFASDYKITARSGGVILDITATDALGNPNGRHGLELRMSADAKAMKKHGVIGRLSTDCVIQPMSFNTFAVLNPEYMLAMNK